MLRLVADLGLESELVASNPKLPRFVYADDNLFALPADLPKLLSPVALIRAGIGVLLPVAKSSDTDETVASFITRVLGEEVLSKVVDPFVSTVYTGGCVRRRCHFPAAYHFTTVLQLLYYCFTTVSRQATRRPCPFNQCFPP
jgi:hypothetical protein